jgi:hypothetical protein
MIRMPGAGCARHHAASCDWETLAGALSGADGDRHKIKVGAELIHKKASASIAAKAGAGIPHLIARPSCPVVAVWRMQVQSNPAKSSCP